MRSLILALILLFAKSSHGQHPDSASCVVRETADIKIKVRGFPAADIVHIDSGSLSAGFELQPPDASFTVTGFRVYYYSKHGDLYWRDVKGPKATPENLPILKSLRPDEWMELKCIGLIKGKQSYGGVPFSIWIDGARL
jgi:hypothetical protein